MLVINLSDNISIECSEDHSFEKFGADDYIKAKDLKPYDRIKHQGEVQIIKTITKIDDENYMGYYRSYKGL